MEIVEIFKKVYTNDAQTPDMSRKVRTTIYIDERIKLIAESLGISLSHAVEDAVIEEAKKRLLVFENMHRLEVVAPPGFEPGSRDPESRRIDHYPTGLWARPDSNRGSLPRKGSVITPRPRAPQIALSELLNLSLSLRFLFRECEGSKAYAEKKQKIGEEDC